MSETLSVLFATNIKKYFLPCLLIVALAVALLKPDTGNINLLAREMQSVLNNAETLFNRSIKDDSLLVALRGGEEEAPIIEKLEKHKIYIYYYQNGNLLHWTSSSVIPGPNINEIENGATLIKLKNGWYQSLKWSDSVLQETVIGLVPIEYDYPFENKFLRNDFAIGMNVPQNIELSEHKISGSIPVKDMEGETLFSLYVAGDEKGDHINFMLLFAQIIILILIFYYIHSLAAFLVNKRGFLLGFSTLLLLIVLVRSVMLYFNIPDEMNKLPLFDPKYYASSVLTKSLGDLVINVLLMLWVVFFFYTRFSRTFHRELPRLVMLGLLAFVFIYTGFILWIFKTLVLDSVISFEVYNILSLDTYSLLGLICIALLLLIHFLLTREIIRQLPTTKVSNIIIVGLSIGYGLVFAAFGLNSVFYEAVFYTALWITIAVVLLWFQLRNKDELTIRNIIICVAVYSLLSTLLIENLYERKERNSRTFFSGKLVSERDYIAEYMFNDITARISDDPFIHNFFTHPFILQREVMDRINVLYLNGYFNKYNFKLYAYDVNGFPIKNPDSTHLSVFSNIFKLDTTANTSLHYISDSTLNYSYLSVIPFYKDSQYLGSLVIRLIPKIYYGQNVYPELLLGNNVTVSNNANNYDYAIYQNNKLIAQYGDFPYSYYWNSDYKFGNKDFVFIEEPKWEHSIQRFPNGKKVIVTVAREPVFEPVATFSYMFTFYFMVLGVVIIAFRVITAQNIKEALFGNLVVSFSTRINFSMLLMILVSFIIIGFVTISFFIRQYDVFYTDRLLRKEKVVHASLEYFIQKNSEDKNLLNDNLSGELNFEIARMADINTIDINLFDQNGNLTISSQPVIYDKGILSRKMNPDAYFKLENNKTAQVIEQESVGGLKYLATYTPVRNYKGEAIAYLGIPYFERSKNINDEVSSFLVALMNVYVFLLICAAILAYFISNSITRPLTIISEKLRVLNLNKKNERIEWNSRDEIGVLVNEYNKMITELEQSAQKLAKGERETAWREMAKQIAHEIKNPLTPMKLSIQYLQRAIDEGNPNIEQLAKKVTKTLEEQIENLSSIASAFSSFAKMPKAQNEIINLNELIRSISELFANEENASVNFTSDSEWPLIFADKNQLVSVFNNLVKNAIQSIPENRKGFIDLHIKEEDGWIITSVSDNGNGIPKDNCDKVFVPNFTTKSSGTGLGLAITKQIIEGAGGSIWFETAESVGTTFFVKLLKSKT